MSVISNVNVYQRFLQIFCKYTIKYSKQKKILNSLVESDRSEIVK